MSKKAATDERAAIEAQIPADFKATLPHRVNDVVDRVMNGAALFAVIVDVREQERKAAKAEAPAADPEPEAAPAPTTKGRSKKNSAALATDAEP